MQRGNRKKISSTGLQILTKKGVAGSNEKVKKIVNIQNTRQVADLNEKENGKMGDGNQPLHQHLCEEIADGPVL